MTDTSYRVQMSTASVCAGGGADVRGLGAGVHKQMTSILRGTWHVLQVTEGRLPGEVTVWALIDSAMHRLTVSVPRTLYVALAPAGSSLMPGAKRVTRTLPDGSLPSTLIELEYTETEVRRLPLPFFIGICFME